MAFESRNLTPRRRSGPIIIGHQPHGAYSVDLARKASQPLDKVRGSILFVINGAELSVMLKINSTSLRASAQDTPARSRRG